MRIWQKITLLILATAIFQSTIAPYLTIKGVQPDFILIVVIFCAFIYGSSIGGIMGFGGGLFQDIILSQTFGINAIIKIILGYLAGFFQRKIFMEQQYLSILAIFLPTILSQILYTIINFMVGIKLPFWSVFWRLLIPMAFYNSLISIFLFPILDKILKEKEELKPLQN